MHSAIDMYNDYGVTSRDLAELRLLLMEEAAERAEQAILASHPVRVASQKTACAYVVHAFSWGPHGQYTSGFV